MSDASDPKTADLKSIADHDTGRVCVGRSAVGAGTGVACPTCGKELRRTDDILRTSIPPRWQVACEDGHYTFIAA